MSARKMLRFLLCSALSLFFSQGVSALDFYWNATNWGDTHFSNPQAACEAFRQRAVSYAGNWITGTSVTVSKVNETQFKCVVTTPTGSPTWGVPSTGYANRFGDSCPNGGTYNSHTGACELPPCAEKIGTSTPFSKSGTGPDSYMWIYNDGKSFAPETSACFDGCVVSTSDQDCTVKVSGAYFCRGTAWFDGQQCGTGGDSPDDVSPSQSSESPQPETTTTETPCVLTSSSGAQMTCTSTSSNESEGKYCGTVNGVKRCFDKPPAKDESTTETTTSSTQNPDGTTTTTKTDKLTSTKCQGVNNCKTTTTTKTTTTVKNASGTTTSVTGTCSGAQCPDKNTNPDADGDGFGDCAGDNCGSGQDQGEGSVTGESCDANLACAGDAIQCAILRQEKEHRCAQEAFQTVTPEEEQQMRTQLETEFAGEEYQPLTPTQETTFDMSSMLDTSREFSASCPSIPDLSFEMNGGQVSIGISEIINQLCSFFAWMGYVVVAFAMRAAAEIIAKGMS